MHKLIVGGYTLDLPPDFGILISKSVASVRSPENRNADVTKTITLPGSALNKKAFTHLFDLNTVIRNTTSDNFSPDFNPNLKADAKHYFDEVLQMRGFLRLNKIIQVEGQIEAFQCTLYSVVADLFSSITEKRLRDLDFSEFNHTLSVTRISESWDTRIQKNGSNYDNFDASGNPTGEGYVYALIDDGSFVNYYGDTNVSQFYPALYKKQIVDKIFEAAGYTYTDDSFFNDTQFKRHVIPCPSGMKLGADDIEERSFEAEAATDQTITTYPTLINFATENSDPGNHYTPSQYTADTSGQVHDFFAGLDLEFSGLAPSNGYAAGFALYKNGVSLSGGVVLFVTDGSGNASVQNTLAFTNVSLNDGDTIDVRFFALNEILGPAVLSFSMDVMTGSLFYNKPKAITWGDGVPVDFASFFNDETTQYDFLKSVFNEFNIYAEPDPDNETEIYLNPREGFYRQTVRDWSLKLDQGQPLEITPMGELNANPYYFTHAKGEDEENKDYQAAYSRVYGDKKFFVDNDFVKEERKIEVIFAPAQLNKADGYDKVLTMIPLEMDNGTGQLRSLYFGGLKSCNPFLVYNSSAMTGTSTSFSSYPLTLHIDDPDSPSLDLCFGMPYRVNLPADSNYTNNNLFNGYWREYITQITDKDSKIVSGMFQISPADMEKLSFRDLYYFERNYYRLNEIRDYNPDVDLTECEFLLLTEGVPFVAGSGGVGGEGEDAFGDLFPANTQRKGVDGSRFGQTALVVGRGNMNGEQSLLVGDNIISMQGSRINSVLGSENVSLGYNVQRATVINSENITTESEELWIQNEKFNLFNPNTGDTPIYNGTEWVPQAPNSGMTLASGLYAPTLDNVTNVDASSSFECQWVRVGNVVTVSGLIEIDNTTANVLTVVGIELPVASTINGFSQLGGTGVSSDVVGLSAQIRGGPSANDAQFRFRSAIADNYQFSFHFTYSIQ